MTGASRARGSPAAPDSGAVTVEAAIALCGFIAVLAMVLAGLSAVLAQIRCTDAAGEAARLAARGDLTHARQVVGSIAGSDAKATFTDHGDTVAVDIVDALGGLLPGVRVRAQAFAVREPDPPDEPAGSTGSATSATTAGSPAVGGPPSIAPSTPAPPTAGTAPVAISTSGPSRRAEGGRR